MHSRVRTREWVEARMKAKKESRSRAQIHFIALISLTLFWVLGNTNAWSNALNPIKSILPGRLPTTTRLFMSDPNYVLMLTSSDVEVDKLWENLGFKTKVKILYVPTAAMWLDSESTSNKSPGKSNFRIFFYVRVLYHRSLG